MTNWKKNKLVNLYKYLEHLYSDWVFGTYTLKEQEAFQECIDMLGDIIWGSNSEHWSSMVDDGYFIDDESDMDGVVYIDWLSEKGRVY